MILKTLPVCVASHYICLCLSMRETRVYFSQFLLQLYCWHINHVLQSYTFMLECNIKVSDREISFTITLEKIFFLGGSSYLSRVLQQEDMQRELWKDGKVCFWIWLVVIRLFLLYEKLFELLFMIYVFSMCSSMKNSLSKSNKTKLAM